MANKKHPKMDPRLVSSEDYELKHLAAKYGAPKKLIRQLQKTTRSREKIEAELIKQGYVVHKKGDETTEKENLW